MLEFVVLVGLATAYLVASLRFEQKDSHWGPWPHAHNQVVDLSDIENPYTQPVTLFDRVRRLFGVYDIVRDDECDEEVDSFDDCEGTEKWFIIAPRMEVWMCPKCLSFWVAIPFAALALLASGSLPTFFFSWFGGAFLSYAANRWLIQMDTEADFDNMFMFADSDDGDGGITENKS